MGPPAHATTSCGGALEKLKSVVMKCAIASAPSKSLSLQQTAFIDKRIQELLPTPHHPPYAWVSIFPFFSCLLLYYSNLS